MKRTRALLAGTIILSVLFGVTISTVVTHASILDSIRGFLAPNNSMNTEMPLYIPAGDYEAAVVNAVERASRAVVSVVITKDLPVIERCRVNPFGDLPPEFRDFFGSFDFDERCDTGRIETQEIGGGSGFIVSPDGLVVTNRHVVADEKADYTVFTNDGEQHKARVIARDPVQDIAIVQIESSRKDFPTVVLSSSENVKLGQTAIAIGNALGEFRNTVSVGIVSGLARVIMASGGEGVERLEGLIQTDAAINPGNSGGPLLNLRGEVIGVNTAVAEGAENIGFAIPVKSVARDVDSVKKTGKISLPYLGVRYILITAQIAKEENLSVKSGAIIRESDDGPGIIPGSPADKAGLKEEDIVRSINGVEITPDRSLASLIQNYKVGDAIQLRILRDSKELTMSVVLVERKS